jgi:transposase Tn5 family protein/transposase-like protein
MSVTQVEPCDTSELGDFDSPTLQGWLAEELQTLDLADKRLNDRCRLILHRLCRHPNFKFNAAAKGKSEVKAAYSFVDHPRIGEQRLLAPHFAATRRRIGEHAAVILANDTTENDLTRPNERVEGAGPLNSPDRWGLFVHPLMAFTPDCLPLGLTAVHIWARDPAAFAIAAKEKAAQRRKKSIEDKESVRWLDGYRAACEVAAACPNTLITYVCDSEGDVFELLFTAAPVEGVRKAEAVIRACQDRSVVSPDDREDDQAKHLFAVVASAAILSTAQIEVSERKPKTADGRKRKQARKARQATVTIQAKRVTLRVPKHNSNGAGSAFEEMSDVTVNAVLVREVNAPEGEEPIEWLLLTTLPIETLTQVETVIGYYCVRWQIEIYFRVLKSGCEVEKSQLETAKRYRNYLALCMIVAWRVMYLMMLGRRCPEMPCDEVLQEDEWQAVYSVVKQQAPPAQAPPLGEMLLLIAALGGYLGRPSDGPPGPKAVWRGLQRMADILLGWRAGKACSAAANPPSAPTNTPPANADPPVRTPPLGDSDFSCPFLLVSVQISGVR